MITVAAVSNLASAAVDWQSVSSRGRPHKSSQLRVEQRGEQRRRFAVCSVLSVIRIKMLPNGASRLSGYPRCLWGNPTGSGNRAATITYYQIFLWDNIFFVPVHLTVKEVKEHHYKSNKVRHYP